MENIPGAHFHAEDFLCMPDSNPSIMQWCCNEFSFTKNDVMVVSYPQQGIFWLQEILWHLNHTEDIEKQVVTPKALGYRVPMLEHEHFGEQPWDLIDKLDSSKPKLLKTHLPRQHLDRHLAEGNVKIIVWLMDPRCALAKFHTFWNMSAPMHKWPIYDWDTFYNMFQEKKLMEGDWFNTTKSFLPELDNPNIIVLKYEDAQDNKLQVLRRIEDFTGNLITNQQEVTLLKKLKFDKAADWKAKFSIAQRKDFNERYIREMKNTPYAETYIDNEI